MGDWQCNFGWIEEEGGDMRLAWLSSICCHGDKKVHVPFSHLKQSHCCPLPSLHQFSSLSTSSSIIPLILCEFSLLSMF